MVQDIIAGAEIAVADKVEGSENDLNAGGTVMQKKKSISGMVRLLFSPTCWTAVTKESMLSEWKEIFLDMIIA